MLQLTKTRRHQILARYFKNQPLSFKDGYKQILNARKLSELPFQQTKGKLWNEVYETLTDLQFLESKNTQISVYDLISDYNDVLEIAAKKFVFRKKSTVLGEFKKAIDQSSFVLKDFPENTFSQIFNLLQWTIKNNDRLWDKLEHAREAYKRPWIHLLNHPGESSSLIRTLSGHTAAIKQCAFNKDGKSITSVSDDENIKIWDVENGKELSSIKYGKILCLSPNSKYIVTRKSEDQIRLLDNNTGVSTTIKVSTGQVKVCKYSPDEQQIISGLDDGTVVLWDLNTGTEIGNFKGHSGSVNDCSISPNDTKILSASNDGTLKIWDIENGAEYLTLSGHNQAVFTCKYSTDGKRIVSASFDNTIKVWNSRSGENLLTITGFQHSLTACSINEDGTCIISGHNDGNMKLWDSITGKELLNIEGHSGKIISCAFSRNGDNIVSASENALIYSYPTIKIWNSSNGEEKLSFNSPKSITKVAFNRDGSRIICGTSDGTVLISDAENGNSITGVQVANEGIWDFDPDFAKIIAVNREEKVVIYDLEDNREQNYSTKDNLDIKESKFSPDSQRIATIDFLGTVQIWDVKTGEEITKLKDLRGRFKGFAFNADGTKIIIARQYNDRYSEVYNEVPEYEINIWDVKTGNELLSIIEHKDWIDNCTFCSNDKRFIASLSFRKHLLKIWDIHSKKEYHILEGHTSEISTIATQTGKEKIISGSADKTLRVWDVNRGKIHNILRGHSGTVTTCAFSPDGEKIISGSQDGTIKLWKNIPENKHHNQEMHDSEVSFLMFINDENLLVTRDHTSAKIWDARNVKLLKTIQTYDHLGKILISPDGKKYATQGFLGPIKIWDIETGNQLLADNDQMRWESCCKFSPDGRKIVAADEKSSFILWDTETGEKIATIEEKLNDIKCCEFSHDGDMLIYIKKNYEIVLWNVNTYNQNTIIKDGNLYRKKFIQSPDGSIFVTFYGEISDLDPHHLLSDKKIYKNKNQKILEIWDCKTGNKNATLKGHSEEVVDCSFSPDGKYIVSCSVDKTLKLWLSETGEEVASLCGHTDIVYSCLFCPEGGMIASVSRDKTIKLWSVINGEEISTLEGHETEINLCKFNSDCKTIVSSAKDQVVRIWKTETGECIAVYKSSTGNITSLDLSPDGNILGMGTEGGNVLIAEMENLLP